MLLTVLSGSGERLSEAFAPILAGQDLWGQNPRAGDLPGAAMRSPLVQAIGASSSTVEDIHGAAEIKEYTEAQ